MAKSNFTLNDFKASISQKGVARHSRFEVTFHPPEGGPYGMSNDPNRREISIRCHVSNMPQFMVETRDFQDGNGQKRKMPTGISHGGSTEFSFYNDAKSITYQTLLAWSHSVLANSELINSHALAYYDVYAAGKVVVKQLDEQDSVTFSWELNEAYPILVEKVGLDSSNTNTAQTIVCTIAYRYATPSFHDLMLERIEDAVRASIPQTNDSEPDVTKAISTLTTPEPDPPIADGADLGLNKSRAAIEESKQATTEAEQVVAEEKAKPTPDTAKANAAVANAEAKNEVSKEAHAEFTKEFKQLAESYNRVKAHIPPSDPIHNRVYLLSKGFAETSRDQYTLNARHKELKAALADLNSRVVVTGG